MLPNNDRKPNEFVDRKVKSHHFGIIVENVVLNTQVSFRWRPKIDNNVQKELNDWATGVSVAPAFIFTGKYRLFLLKINILFILSWSRLRKTLLKMFLILKLRDSLFLEIEDVTSLNFLNE